ncbi:purine-binding chemotaxis protein CheW [Thiogranum longum]|uniref:Purine-binding chemotaxis protein CheW n=1 Tax=Thiogranum longum TaxID=1537524 RepID=A0A4R1HHE7_9GAMM|nr:chemotaxis protein CheW [Thiogranum longum]TCK18819.1 purine-binding chemotaxis protein CheW [Thiogranum longum]
MKATTKQDSLLEQQLALGSYLDALLTGVPTPLVQVTEIQRKAEEQAPVEVQPVQPEQVTVSLADTVPEWAETRFQALLFEVAGLTLAVPLAKLKGVVQNMHGLTEIPGYSSLFPAVMPYQGVQSTVVDTARFVLPPDRAAQLDDDISERAAQLVVVDGGRWSLACSRIGDVIDLEAGQVKWRTAAGKRRWLAGSVIEQMCALLDIDELARQLAEAMA